jgi:hypothetical protein
LKDLSKDNRGDLITMIGKFYESLEAEKWVEIKSYGINIQERF